MAIHPTDDTSIASKIASKIKNRHSACHGLVVIVTNDYTNTQLASLPSTHKDGEEMEIAFKRLDFVTHWVKNASSQQLRDLVSQITELSQENCKDFIGIAFIFSGHGGEADTLGMQDDESSVSLYEDIITPLISYHDLAEIPKLFFIDACRGAGAGDIRTLSKSFRLSKVRSKKLHSLVGNYFLAYSTIPKNQAYLVHDYGSIWMQKIAQQLKKDVDSVQHIVANTTRIIWDEYNPQDNNVQQPQSIDTLTCGPLYLQPSEFRKC